VAYPHGHIHVIWDNLNIHRPERWVAFNQRHGQRLHFHYTPLHASWVNQIECWFSMLSRRVLRHGSFRHQTELAAAVSDFISYWNAQEAQPFRWTFTGYPLQTDGLAA